MTPCYPHRIINVDCFQPTCGTQNAQWNVPIEQRRLDRETTRPKFDINLSCMDSIRYKIDQHRDRGSLSFPKQIDVDCDNIDHLLRFHVDCLCASKVTD